MSMKTKERLGKQRVARTSGPSITPQASKGEVGARRRLSRTGLEAQMEFKLKERAGNVYESKGSGSKARRKLRRWRLDSPPWIRRGQGWLIVGPPPPPPPPPEEGSHFHGSRSCPSADGHPETMTYPGARASCPHHAWDCGTKCGLEARAPGYFQSGAAEPRGGGPRHHPSSRLALRSRACWMGCQAGFRHGGRCILITAYCFLLPVYCLPFFPSPQSLAPSPGLWLTGAGKPRNRATHRARPQTVP